MQLDDKKTINFSNTSRYFEIANSAYNNVERFVVSRNGELRNKPVDHCGVRGRAVVSA